MRTGIRSLLTAAAAGTALTALSAFAAEADPRIVGRAALVQDLVRGRTTTDERVIKLDDLMRFQEQVVTGPKSKAIIEFRDGTTLELGPNGALTIDRMVFDPAGGKKEKTVSLSRGLFRLVSGAAAPDASTTLRTPSGTIGIRGSLVSGIVPSDPRQPTVIVGGSGDFTVTTGGGTTELTGGQSTILTGPDAPPVPARNVPPGLTLAVIGQVTAGLGAQPPALPPAAPAVRQVLAAANTVPAQQQQQQQPAGQPVAAPAPTGQVAPPPQVTQAVRNGSVGPASAPPPPNAPGSQQLASYAQQQRQVNDLAQRQATQSVVQGLATVQAPQDLAAAVQQIANGNPAQADAARGASGLSPQQLAQGSALPPALQAAIASGNPAAVRQVINTVSAGDPQRAAALAQQAVAAAERLLPTNPNAAVAVAGAVMQIVGQGPVQTAAPAEVLETLTVAARIFVAPDAQRVAPQQVAELSAQAVRVATAPAVYQASPQAAIGVLAAAYRAVTAPGVQAAVPTGAATVAQLLSQAAQQQALTAANPSNGPQIIQILESQAPAVEQRLWEATVFPETPMRTELNSFQASPT